MTMQEQLARREFLKQMTTASAAALACGGTRGSGEYSGYATAHFES